MPKQRDLGSPRSAAAGMGGGLEPIAESKSIRSPRQAVGMSTVRHAVERVADEERWSRLGHTLVAVLTIAGARLGRQEAVPATTGAGQQRGTRDRSSGDDLSANDYRSAIDQVCVPLYLRCVIHCS